MSDRVGDRVRVAVPERDDSDHRYHGEVEAVLEDELSGVTGDPRDDDRYRVAFDDDALGTMSFRQHDVRRAGADA